MDSPIIGFRSYFSLLRGCLSPEDVCRTARERSLPAVALADVNNLYGLIRFLQAARREGVRPVAGAVLMRPGSDAQSAQRGRNAAGAPQAGPGSTDRELFTAYVLDRGGYSRLCRLLTDALMDGSFDPVEDLAAKGWEGLAVLSGRPDVLERLARPQSSPPSAPQGLYAELRYGSPFARLAGFARERGIPAAATAVVSFLDQGDEQLYPLLRAIDLNVTLEHVPPAENAPPGRRLASLPEMERFFSAVPEALANAGDIMRRSSVEGIISPRFIFPAYEGRTDDESFRLLSRLCEEGAIRRYGADAAARADIRSRLDYELAIIREKGFSSYFLVVRDIVRQCPRTCGRGSAASSLVSYLLGITHVDPIRYTLFFERFLNRGRKDPPDIDVDFPWDERDGILRYVFSKHAGRAAMVANHVTFGPRSCLRDPAKAMGITEEEIGRLVRLFRHGRLEELPPYLTAAAARLKGMPRNLGTHCGGVIITPGPITDYTHVQTSPLGYPVIAWEKDATEEAGLVKIDLLGNRSLGVLRDTLALVEANHGVRLDWEGFDPLRDTPTRDLIASGNTLGVFYVESPATRQLLSKMRAGDYENLVIASSIIRPAANKYIRIFVKRLHGAPYTPLHPRIESTLAETFGVMVYQEDVSRVAIDLAGFPIEEADRLRKILSKKDRELRLPDFRQRFFEGGKSRGVEERTLEKVWEMILSFDGYSFCKAHSASYAQVSYRLAYMKRFYPLEFIASVINNGGGFYGRQTYVDECRRMGFPVLPPDVGRSGLEYTVEPPDPVERGAAGEGALGEPPAAGGAGSFSAEGATSGRPGLRVGLGQLRDVPGPFLEALIAERRKGGPFTGFHDFLRRVRPHYSELRILIRSGALDSISDGCTRPQLFFRFQNGETEEGFGFAPPAPPAVGDYPRRIKLRDEVETLGLVVSTNPITLFRARIDAMVRRHGLSPFLRSSREIPSFRGSRVWIAGILVTGKEVATKTREPMIFVSFEDEHSVFETVLFPDAFRKYYPALDGGWAFLIRGRVEEDLGAIAISVETLIPLSRQAEGSAAGRESSAGLPASAGPRVFMWGYGQEGEDPEEASADQRESGPVRRTTAAPGPALAAASLGGSPGSPYAAPSASLGGSPGRLQAAPSAAVQTTASR